MLAVSHPHAALAPVSVCIGQAIEIVLDRPECGHPAGFVLRGKIANRPVPGSVMGVVLDDYRIAVGYVVRRGSNYLLCQFGRSELLPIHPEYQIIELQQ